MGMIHLRRETGGTPGDRRRAFVVSRLADVAQSRTSARGCIELKDGTDLLGLMRGPSSPSASRVPQGPLGAISRRETGAERATPDAAAQRFY